MSRRTATLDLLERDPSLPDALLARITTDEDKRPFEVCAEMGLSWGAFLAWCNADGERIRKLKDALEIRSYLLGEDALEIADGAPVLVVDKEGKPVIGDDGKPLLHEHDVPRDKLRVETRFRLARAFNSKVFGEKQQVEHSGSVTSLMAVLSSLPRGNEIDVTPSAPELEPVDAGGCAPPILVPKLPVSTPTPSDQEI